MSEFPVRRMRRLRQSEVVRRLVRDVVLSRDDLVMPLFVVPGEGVEQPIASMPGQSRYSADRLVEVAKRLEDKGISAIILFGLPEHKDAHGSHAWDANGVVQRALRQLREAQTRLLLITDVCLCAYTDHGHCGVLAKDGVANDVTLDLLAKQAVSHAQAGADVVAPSDMMDGRVGAIRDGLDEAGFTQTLVLAYAAKYASSFYGPFREAADSAPQSGDRKSYQMDPAASRQARMEIELDIAEGADMVMVKPAGPYLDIIAEARASWDVPIVAYQVSGEYAMIEAAAANGWLDRKGAILESLIAIKRAGADLILTYFAEDVAGWL